MPIGQAHTTWFPALKEILGKKWNKKHAIPEQFKLVEELNKKLAKIRKEGNMQPPMIWCPSCQKRHRGSFSKVSITAMYYALEREGHCSHAEFLTLKREWNKYSKSKGINVYGEEIEEKSTKAQHDI